MAGSLIVGPLTISGEVLFRLELAGENAGIELVVNASIDLSPIGQLTLSDSGFRISSQGLVARLSFSIALGGDFGGGIGLGIEASALVQLNTTGRAQTLGTSTVEAGFRLRVTGSVDFLGFA